MFDVWETSDPTADKPLAGQTFCITGLLDGKDRHQLEQELRDLGAIVRNRVVRDARCLIVGTLKPSGSEKVTWAQRKGVEQVAWADFAASFANRPTSAPTPAAPVVASPAPAATAPVSVPVPAPVVAAAPTSATAPVADEPAYNDDQNDDEVSGTWADSIDEDEADDEDEYVPEYETVKLAKLKSGVIDYEDQTIAVVGCNESVVFALQEKGAVVTEGVSFSCDVLIIGSGAKKVVAAETARAEEFGIPVYTLKQILR